MKQRFAGNTLNRSLGDRKNPNFMADVLAMPKTAAVVIVSDARSNKKVICEKNGSKGKLSKFSIDSVLTSLQINSINQLMEEFLVVLLGFDDRSNCWMVAVDVSKTGSDNVEITETFLTDKKLRLESGRSILVKLQRGEIAIAGQALAMCGWHATNSYCSRTGFATVPIECGLKRRPVLPDGSSSKQHVATIYPRTDPVVIAAVMSPDRSKILLGHMKTHPKNFYSCLSGFIEPCEAIQEAVVREVWEESGILIDVRKVEIIDSQPWPIARSGGCELMIGCFAVASTETVEINDPDVGDARWFTIKEASAMIEASIVNAKEALTDQPQPYIPGAYAIAHHLIQLCVERSEEGNSYSSIYDRLNDSKNKKKGSSISKKGKRNNTWGLGKAAQIVVLLPIAMLLFGIATDSSSVTTLP